MNLDTLTMPREQAETMVRDYRELWATERTAENRALLTAARAAAKGRPMIRLSEAVLAGGFDDDGRPKVAVARATAQRCWVNFEHGRIVFTDNEETSSWRVSSAVGDHHVAIPHQDQARGWRRRAVTMVPSIPPAARRTLGRYSLGTCHVIWEVERWEVVPPVDPALIRQVAGDLWQVLHTWDLTELERAVIAGTRRVAPAR